MHDPARVAQLLNAVQAGDKTALDQLFDLVYTDLRRLAESCLRGERPGHTLQGSALVHEAYLRLREQRLPALRDRAHFLKLATRIMRQVLVDHARHRNVAKRSVEMPVSLDQAGAAVVDKPLWMVHLDDALSELEKRDQRKARLIELRYFSGLTAEESAVLLAMEVAEVRRELRAAQAWLRRQLARHNRGPLTGRP
jgi:RNA polymerase sigma factor (TIGR02999 family)